MKKHTRLILTAAVLVSLLLSTSGCINLTFGRRTPPPPPPAAPVPVIVMPTPPLTPGDTATIAEVDAAARLNFETPKQQALVQIAQRPGLAPAVQVHLVNVTYRSLAFDHSKVQVLHAMIGNPGFSDAARHAIVTQLGRLAFDSHKQEILRELNQRVGRS